MVGPAIADAAQTPSASKVPARGTAPPPTADGVARQNSSLFQRGYALVTFNPNDCAGRHNTPQYRWKLGIPQYALLSCLSRIRLGHPGRLGVGRVTRGGLPGDRSQYRQDQTDHHRSFAQRQVVDDCGSLRRAFDGCSGRHGRRWSRRQCRFAGPRRSETLDIMQKKYPNWFSPHLHEFWGQREKLPFDEHWFLALAAPRAFIALEGDTDTISLPEAVRQSVLAAQPAYALFGVKDRLGVNYAKHGHAFTAEDWTAMMDFTDKHLLGKEVDRMFDRFPTEQELDEAAAAGARGGASPRKQ